MKKFLMIFLIGCGAVTLLAACDEPNELTPKVDSVTDDYLLPRGTILTEQERQEVLNKVNEYNEAINE